MDLIGIYHSHPDCAACLPPPICESYPCIPSWCSPFRRGESTTPQAGCPTSSRPKPPGGVDLLKIRGRKATESEIDVTEVKAKLDRETHFVLGDRRARAAEYTICHIPPPADPAGRSSHAPGRARPRSLPHGSKAGIGFLPTQILKAHATEQTLEWPGWKSRWRPRFHVVRGNIGDGPRRHLLLRSIAKPAASNLASNPNTLAASSARLRPLDWRRSSRGRMRRLCSRHQSGTMRSIKRENWRRCVSSL